MKALNKKEKELFKAIAWAARVGNDALTKAIDQYDHAIYEIKRKILTEIFPDQQTTEDEIIKILYKTGPTNPEVTNAVNDLLDFLNTEFPLLSSDEDNLGIVIPFDIGMYLLNSKSYDLDLSDDCPVSVTPKIGFKTVNKSDSEIKIFLLIVDLCLKRDPNLFIDFFGQLVNRSLRYQQDPSYIPMNAVTPTSMYGQYKEITEGIAKIGFHTDINDLIFGMIEDTIDAKNNIQNLKEQLEATETEDSIQQSQIQTATDSYKSLRSILRNELAKHFVFNTIDLNTKDIIIDAITDYCLESKAVLKDFFGLHIYNATW